MAEAVKTGVESAGGSAEILQYVLRLCFRILVLTAPYRSESLKPFPTRSSPSCTLLLSPITPSSSPTSLSTTMRFCSVSLLVTVTSLDSGRYASTLPIASACPHVPFVTGFLGRYRWLVGQGCSCGQVCWRLRLHWYSRWRTRCVNPDFHRPAFRIAT